MLDEVSKKEFRDFLIEEVHEIERHKWIESEKAGYDLGSAAIMEWLRVHAKSYRETHNRNNI